MKWFKHYSNAHNSKFLSMLLNSKNGKELYTEWFLLLEYLCSEFKDNQTEWEISEQELTEVLKVKYPNKMRRIIEVFAKFSQSFDKDLFKFSSSFDKVLGKFYKISTPIILELMGRDFKKARSSCEKTTPKKKEERNKNKEIRINPIIPLKNFSGSNCDKTKIIDHWNDAKIIVHKKSDNLVSDVGKIIKTKKLSADDVLKAIDNYKFILSDENFIWSHKWSLKEFLKRENAEKFFPEEFNLDRFPKKQISKAYEKQNNMLNMENPYAKK